MKNNPLNPSKEKVRLSQAVADFHRDDPCTFWRLKYQDKPFNRALVEELNKQLELAELGIKARPRVRPSVPLRPV